MVEWANPTFELVAGLGKVVVLEERVVNDANSVLELALVVLFQLAGKRSVRLSQTHAKQMIGLSRL